MGVTAAIAIPAVLSTAGSAYGAHEANKTNQANLDAQQQNRAQIQGMANGMMMQGQNAYASQYGSMLSALTGGKQQAYNPLDSRVNSPFTYNPTLTGDAPQIGAGSIPQVGAAKAEGNNLLSPQQISAPAAIGTQGFNPGQDALMQMLGKDIQTPTNALLDKSFQSLVGGQNQFDTSGLFKALDAQKASDTDQQVAGLHASATDLGKRFGTQMGHSEAILRAQIENTYNLQKSQASQSAFENAQNRALSATGQLAGFQASQQQLPFQQAQLQLNAAQGLGGLYNQGQGLSLQAQSSNADNYLRAALANQGTSLQAGQTLAQLSQANAGFQQNASQLNAGNFLQAMLANQGVQSQYGLTNANIANQAGQFNATAGQTAQQFNASQGQAYNQMLLNLISGGQNAQQYQNSYNQNLLSIMAGLQVPQQQYSATPGAISGAGNDIMSAILMQQFLARPKTGSAVPPSTASPSQSYF